MASGKRVKKKGRDAPPSAAERPRLEEEERTLEAFDSLPSPWRGMLVALYLVGAYWPWWLTFLVASVLLWRIAGLDALLYAVYAFAALALGGYLMKRLLERFAKRLTAP